MPSVKQFKETLKGVLKELEQMPEDLEVVHILSPDGCYSGDEESTFHTISVELDHSTDFGRKTDPRVYLTLEY